MNTEYQNHNLEALPFCFIVNHITSQCPLGRAKGVSTVGGRGHSTRSASVNVLTEIQVKTGYYGGDIIQRMAMVKTVACCRCNRTGVCRGCACVKADRPCLSCLPSQVGRCLNIPQPSPPGPLQQAPTTTTQIINTQHPVSHAQSPVSEAPSLGHHAHALSCVNTLSDIARLQLPSQHSPMAYRTSGHTSVGCHQTLTLYCNL